MGLRARKFLRHVKEADYRRDGGRRRPHSRSRRPGRRECAQVTDGFGQHLYPAAFLRRAAAALDRTCTDSPEELEVRLRNAPEELKQYSAFDYVIINDKIDRASAQLASIIYAERARCMRQESLVREVINKFKGNSI